VKSNPKKKRHPYQDPALPIEKRVADLLGRMTLEEKIAQMGASHFNAIVKNCRLNTKKFKAIIRNLAIGAIHQFSWSDSEPQNTIDMNMAITNKVQEYLVENTRLGIPAIITGEGVHGHWAHNATVFPHAIAMSSSWNPGLLQRIAGAVARESRSAGVGQLFSPVLDLAREPRWGRVQETYGEDPYLTERMGVAFIKGVQGEGAGMDFEHCAATAKHYLAHGSPESGINISPVSVGPREVKQLYMKPFKAAVKEAGVLSVMPAYHEIDGIPMACHYEYLTNILKREWGFRGYTYSDWGAVLMLHNHHFVASSREEAGKMAVEAGVDMDAIMQCYGRKLFNLAKKGKVSARAIDEAARRILRVKFLLGLFENPYADIKKARKARNCAEHRRLARQAAQESIILLKNEGGLLPLKDGVKSIAVIGPNADKVQLGNYSGWNDNMVSPLQGIKNRAPKGTKVRHARGCGLWERNTKGFAEAVDIARRSDIAIVVVGESTVICTEGTDVNDLELAGVQLDLVKAVRETGTPTVVALVNGRHLAISWIAENVPAILETWFAGEEQGNAMADILWGDINPSGKLPVSLPRSTGHIPVFYNKKPSALGFYKQPGTLEKPGRDYALSSPAPLFDFGFGLSYTRFKYADLKVTPNKIHPAEKVMVSVKVRNAGKRAGAEVVQLYINDIYSSVETPARQLKGFEKVWLERGEERTIRFSLGPSDLALVNRSMDCVVERGEFAVMVGGLKTNFEVK